jgi:hypothetical protein
MKLGEARTSEERLAEAAIAAVGDWSGSSISYRDVTAPVMSPMHKGVDSLCFAVDVDEDPVFLKIVHPELRSEIDVSDVFAAASASASMGVTPAPVRCLPDHGAIVFQRLDEGWRSARTDDLRKMAVMMPVIDAKRRIHLGPRFARTWSVFDGIRAFPSDVIMAAPVAPTELLWMIDAAHDIAAAFDGAGFDTVPCHADGLASNVMVGPNEAVQLVDFDTACNTDPIYDLAIVLNEAYAFEEEMRPALEAFEGSVRSSTLDRCRLYGIADDLYWALWSSKMNLTSSRHGIEFLKYAQWRFLRCRMALQDPDFERKLRSI